MAMATRNNIANVPVDRSKYSGLASVQQSTRLEAQAVLLAWALMPYIRAVPRTSPFISLPFPPNETALPAVTPGCMR